MIEDATPDDLRDLAQKVVGKLGGEAAAVVLGSGDGGKALLVAAVRSRWSSVA